MLRLLEDRLSNTIGEELHIAMGEQMKISILRFQKLITEGDWAVLKPSQLTTHVLDTAIGMPGRNISIRLQMPVNGAWQTIAQGITNADGRIGDLLPAQRNLVSGNYKMVLIPVIILQHKRQRAFILKWKYSSPFLMQRITMCPS